jgi:hypothetical protein
VWVATHDVPKLSHSQPRHSPTIQSSSQIQAMRSHQRVHRMRCVNLSVLALMVLWVFPRPVVHSHEEFESSSPSAITLEEHLKEFHAQNSPPDKTFHVHWVLNNGSILLASCNAPSPTIITSLSSPDLADAAVCAFAFNPPSIDLLATQGLSSVLASGAFPSWNVVHCDYLPRAFFQPSLLALSCLLAC